MKRLALAALTAFLIPDTTQAWVEPAELPEKSTHTEGTRLKLTAQEMAREPMGWVTHEGKSYHFAPFDPLDNKLSLGQLCEALFRHNINFASSRFLAQSFRKHITARHTPSELIVLENIFFLRGDHPMLLPLAILQFTGGKCVHIDTAGLTPLPPNIPLLFTAKSNLYYHDYTFHELYRRETPQGACWYNENRPDILYPIGE